MSAEKTKLSPDERAKRVEAVRYARGSMGLVEGYRPSAFSDELQARWIEGEISVDEAIAETLQHYRVTAQVEPKQG